MSIFPNVQSSGGKDLLPIPRPFPKADDTFSSEVGLSRSVNRRLLRKHRWQQWANDAVDTVNQLYGHGEVVSETIPNAAQEACLTRLKERFSEVGCPPPDLSPAGAFQELCGTVAGYGDGVDEAGPRVNYRPGHIVSLPSDSCLPVDPSGQLTGIDFDRWSSWKSLLLREPREAALLQSSLGLKQPYSDPGLVGNRVEYAKFLKHLAKLGLVRFGRSRKSTVGLFFVAKKDGRLRLIFDTRIANCVFVEPPHTELPTSAAFSKLEAPVGTPIYLAQSDLDNAFYHLLLPPGLSEFFVLPPARAGDLGLTELDGVPLSPDYRVSAEMIALPMGWSWALHICQKTLEGLIANSGHAPLATLRDRSPSIPLDECNQVAPYVDNFAVMGTDRHTVKTDLDSIVSHADGVGLPCHPASEPELSADFIGIRWEGGKGRVHCSPRRMWKLRLAIAHVLRTRRASGDQLRRLVGHFTFCALLRREVLSILSASYAFAEKLGHRTAVLWDSVLRELKWASSILPLLSSDMWLPWSDQVHASDASTDGAGVCYTQAPEAWAARQGRIAEKWRYSVEEAISARKHALSDRRLHNSEAPECIPRDPATFDDLSKHYNIPAADFNEVELAELNERSWKTAIMRPWNRKENILKLEGVALISAIRHSLRSIQNLRKRHLFLVGNLPLALAIGKGRARSPYLLPICRQACALSLISGSQFLVRWIASEQNPADAPSRSRTFCRRPQSGTSAVDSGQVKEQLCDAIKTEANRNLDCDQLDREHCTIKRETREAGSARQHKENEEHNQGGRPAHCRHTSKSQLHTAASHCGGGRLPLLAQLAVQVPTGDPYRDYLNTFLRTMELSSVEHIPPESLDRYLSDFFDLRFMQGYAAEQGEKTLAALQHFHPEYGKFGRHSLPLTGRCLKGWRRIAPGHARLPIPWLALMAMVGQALFENQTSLALALLIMFFCYLRPGETMELVGDHLVPPGRLKTTSEFGGPYWGIVIRPRSEHKPSKVGAYDESVLLDVDPLQWMGPVLHTMHRLGNRSLWPFDHAKFNALFQKLSTACGFQSLMLHPYCLRHGGASHDATEQIRTVEQIKNRGRWSSDKSVKRYMKAARAQQQVHKIPEQVQKYGEWVGKNLSSLFAHRHLRRPVPAVGR